MKKQLLYGMMLLLPVAAWAYDFSAVHEGQTLYFNLTGGDEATVVNETGSSSPSQAAYNTYPAGEVVIPDVVVHEGRTLRVTSVGAYAFCECADITSVVVGSNVQSISNNAFYDCTSLTRVVLGQQVGSVGSRAFYGCSNLYDIDLLNPTATGLSRDNFTGTAWLDGFGEETVVYLGTVALGFNFPGQVPAGAASNYAQTAIELREGTTAVADNAFDNHYISASSGSAGAYPLETVRYVTLPRSLTHIGSHAFTGCTDALTVVTIPENVQHVGSGAFTGCSALERVTWLAEDCELEASVLPTGLEAIEFGKAVRTVPAHICEGNTAMASVAIPHEVTAVGDRAFYRCTGLSQVAIGAGVASLGEGAFTGCTDLTTIQCYAIEPPAAPAYCFLDVPITASVQIPCGCIPAYEAADEWAYFWSFTEIIAYTATGYSTNEELGTVSVEQTCAEATFRAEPLEGCRFVQWSDGNTDNPRIVPLQADVELLAEFRAETTGLDQVWDDGTEVYAHGGTLHIANNDREATVYDTTGRTVYQGFERAIALDRSGLYIVEIDGKRTKVVM